MKKLLVLAALAACRVAPPQATSVDAERAHIALAELQQGRTLLVQKCGNSCHVAPLPSQHSALEWPAKLDEMSARAGLDLGQRHLIEQYLVTMAAR
jgi:hypothetical protein